MNLRLLAVVSGVLLSCGVWGANGYDVVVLQDESAATINAPHAFLDYADQVLKK